MRSRAASAAKKVVEKLRGKSGRMRGARQPACKGYRCESVGSTSLRNNPKMNENGCYLLMFSGLNELFVQFFASLQGQA